MEKPDDWRRLPRLHHETPLAAGAAIELGREPAHYLTHVLRMQTGAALRLFNRRDGEWRGILTASGKHSASFRIEDQLRAPQPAPDLWLCAAPIKKAHFDYMIEKATELGIGTFQPMLTERAQIRETNTERLRSIAVEAAEQSERLDVPEILPAAKLPELVAHWPVDRLPVICAEWGEAQPAASALSALPPSSKAAFFTGPEGGFTENEFAALRQLPNALFIRLGPRILRADTAAIAALSCWQAIRGDWV